LLGVDFPELLLICLVAIVVIGPKDLPKALHAAGKFTRKFRMIVADVQKSLDNVMQDAELDEITREANKAGGENLQFEIDKQIIEEERIIAKLEESSDDSLKK
jgi:sec-independent protein translocase protein TatB